jgi:hypothetical protein
VCGYDLHVGLCRHHHQLKQQLGWLLIQTHPGSFQWQTPTGRIYQCTPDIYAA